MNVFGLCLEMNLTTPVGKTAGGSIVEVTYLTDENGVIITDEQGNPIVVNK